MKLKEKLARNKTFRKVLFLTFIFIILGSFIFLINNLQEDKMEDKETEGLYQGPVRPTDDEDYFRKTGITKPKEVEE